MTVDVGEGKETRLNFTKKKLSNEIISLRKKYWNKWRRQNKKKKIKYERKFRPKWKIEKENEDEEAENEIKLIMKNEDWWKRRGHENKKNEFKKRTEK